MKLPVPLLLATFGLLAGASTGSYWYASHGRAALAEPASGENVNVVSTNVAFVDLDRKFVIPLVRGHRVQALIVTELKLEVDQRAEDRAREMTPRLRDAFLGTLYAMAVEGLFDGDLFSHSVQDRMRQRLLEAARGVLQGDARAVLIAELLRQDR